MQASLPATTPTTGAPPLLPAGQMPMADTGKPLPGVGFGEELAKLLAAASSTDPAAAPPSESPLAASEQPAAAPPPLAPAQPVLPQPPMALPAAAPLPTTPVTAAPAGTPTLPARDAQPARRQANARAATADAAAAVADPSMATVTPAPPCAAPIADSLPPQPILPGAVPAKAAATDDSAAAAPALPMPSPQPLGHSPEPPKPQAADPAVAASHAARCNPATAPVPDEAAPEPVASGLAELAARAVAAPQTPAASSPTAPATPAPAHATATGSPAVQVAPALVSMFHAPDGTQRLTLRLDPPDLGQVQIRIDRPADAPARVEITVERAETLTLLLRDQPQLQRALDQAGVPPDGRSVTFHITASEASPHADGAAAPAPGAASAGPSGDGWHGASRQGGGHPRHDGAAPDDGDADFVPVALPGWLRTGLDITA